MGVKKAYTICCNDWIVAISLGSEVKAKRLMRTYMLKDYRHSKWRYENLTHYKWLQFWHIHHVQCH